MDSEHFDDEMSGEARRSGSLSGHGREEASSLDCEKRGEDASSMKEEEENIGMEEIEKCETQELESPLEENADHCRVPHPKSLRSIHSHRSYAAGDGYTCFTEQEEQQAKASRGVVEAEPFLVTWDGDSDPMNPRSMSKLRRWSIILIIAASSLCV